jgi:hypothetical protein
MVKQDTGFVNKYFQNISKNSIDGQEILPYIFIGQDSNKW